MTIATLPTPCPRDGGRGGARREHAPFLPGIALLIAAVLGGCASDPALAPHEKMPTQQEAAARLQLGATTAPPIAGDWWAAFDDPQLTHWIELGLADSPSLHEAAARLAQAQAYAASAHAAQLPNVGFAADSLGTRISSNGIYPPPLGGLVGTINDIDIVAAFDLDLFGALAARTDAARLDAEASEADRAQARVGLAAAIGHAYFELARAQRAQKVAQEIEDSRKQTLDLVRQRVQAGFDTQVERRLAEETVPEVGVEIERDAEQIALARHGLAVLAGQAPSAADGVEARLPDRHVVAPPEALPLDLLARRADVAAAHRRVLATLRKVDAARADFYPNVNLMALAGVDALTMQRIFEYNSRTWQFEPAVHLPIFDGGALRANLRNASAQTDAAIDQYNTAILRAAREVADALSSLASVERQRAQQEQATTHAQAASELATIRYRAGLGNYLSVLTAQTEVLAQRRNEVDLDGRAAALDVSLALALGGGYRDARATAETAARTQ